MNMHIPSAERATVISLRRTLILPFSALGMAGMGILSDCWSPRATYILGFTAMAASMMAYAKTPKGSEQK